MNKLTIPIIALLPVLAWAGNIAVDRVENIAGKANANSTAIEIQQREIMANQRIIEAQQDALKDDLNRIDDNLQLIIRELIK